MASLDPRRVERWLIVLIALHSVSVGIALTIFTDWSTTFGGWGPAEPRFFARQAGVFHLAVALGYLLEYQRYRGIGLLVTAKSIAVVFLLLTAILGDDNTWAVPLSALADGLMAAAVILVHRWASRRAA